MSALSSDDGVPSEFRIFRAGKNTSSKGSVIFDDEAAAAVMAAYKTQGVRVMLDLEHMSLDDAHPNWDPDARGWFDLEVRNGELWATNLVLTPDGERRLKDKTQVYISPCFTFDDDRRVTEIVNVALVAMPATHAAPQLVAASARGKADKTKTLRALQLAALALLSART